MNLSEFYFKVNPVKRIIIDSPKKLDHNWKNISGFIYLPEDKIEDLSWAGYPDEGFIKICKSNIPKLEEYSSSFDTLASIKNIIKSYITTERNLKESNTVTINGKYSIHLTDKCKLALCMKYMECLSKTNFNISWKTNSGYLDLNDKEFKNLFLNIQIYIDNLFKLEKQILDKINQANSYQLLLDVDTTLKCDSNLTI